MNKIKITTLATALAAATLAYGQNNFEVFETRITVNTSDIKEIAVRLDPATAPNNPLRPGQKMASLRVPYRAPIRKNYTILMAYNHDTNDSYGRMWANDRREAVVVKARTDHELENLREDGTFAGASPHLYAQTTYNGGFTPIVSGKGGDASPIGQRGLDHPYYGVFYVTDASEHIEHAVPVGAEIELRGLATHTRANTRLRHPGDQSDFNVQYLGMAARSRVQPYTAPADAVTHATEFKNMIQGVAFGDGFYPVRPMVPRSANPVRSLLHKEQGLGELGDAHKSGTPHEIDSLATHVVGAGALHGDNVYNYEPFGAAFMPKANLMTVKGNLMLNEAHFHGSFTTRRMPAVLNQRIQFLDIDPPVNGKPAPARLAANWDELQRIINFRVPAAQRWTP